MLEVGCGTGQATLPLARRGYGMLCVELGENLAALARDNAARYPRAQVVTGDFEKFPVPQGVVDLLLSATAFHWLDPAVAYPKAAAQALKPGGAIALFWDEHVHPGRDRGFRQGLQTGASSRPRSESLRARRPRRPRSGTKATRARPYPKTSRTGRRRSIDQGSLNPSPNAPTADTGPAKPPSTSRSSTPTLGT